MVRAGAALSWRAGQAGRSMSDVTWVGRGSLVMERVLWGASAWEDGHQVVWFHRDNREMMGVHWSWPKG